MPVTFGTPMQERKHLFDPVPTSTGTPLDAENISILTDPKDILERWKGYFSTLLNWDSTPAEDFLRNVPHHPTELVYWSRKKNPFKLPEHGRRPLKARFFALILNIWKAHKAPKDLKDAVIINIFKKGDRRLWTEARMRSRTYALLPVSSCDAVWTSCR